VPPFLRYVLQFIAYLLLQQLVFNNLVLSDWAMAHVFILFLLVLPIELNLAAYFLIAFCLGLLVSYFQPPVGAAAVACLAVAGLRRLWVSAITPQIAYGVRNELDMSKQGYGWAASYLVPCVFLYELVYQPVADLSLGWLVWVKILLSTLYTSTIVLLIFLFFYKKS